MIGEGVVQQVEKRLERHRGHVGSGQGGLLYVGGMADRGRQEIGVEVIVVVDLNDLLDQFHAAGRDVVDATDEGADVVGPGLRRQHRLRGGEAEGTVRLNTLLVQRPQGFDAVFDQGNFHDDVLVDLVQLTGLLHHAIEVGGRHLSGHVPVHDLADFEDVLVEVDVALFLDEGRVRGHPVEDAHVIGFSDFVQIGRVDEKLHGGVSDLVVDANSIP